MTYENGNHTKMVTYDHMEMWTYENGNVWKMVTYARIYVTFLSSILSHYFSSCCSMSKIYELFT